MRGATVLHFPEPFPVDALSVIAPIIRSGGVITDKVVAGEAVLTLQGWAMGQYLGHEHGPNVVGASAPHILSTGSRQAASKALDELEAGVPTTTTPRTVGAFNFKKFAENVMAIVQFLLPLILAS